MTRRHRLHGRADMQSWGYPMSMPAPARSHEADSALRVSARVAAPPDVDRELMASLAIELDAGAYRFDGMRFGSLADAVRHARFEMRRQEDAGGR